MTELTPYEQAARLFDGYPLAVTLPGWDMILITPPVEDFADPGVFVLSRDVPYETSAISIPISIRRWGSGRRHEDVAAPGLSDEFRTAVRTGVPWPLASLYGWIEDGEVIAVISVYSWPGREDDGLPTFSFLPRAGLRASAAWLAATNRVFGWWWWRQVQAGRIVRLAPVIAPTTGTVTWKARGAGPHGVVGVHADLQSPDEGWVLPSGVYAYYTDGPPPLLTELHIRQRGVRDLACGLAWEAAHTSARTP